VSTAAARDEGSKERKRSKRTNGNPCPSRRNKSTQKTEYSLLPVATAFLSNEQTSMAVTNSKETSKTHLRLRVHTNDRAKPCVLQLSLSSVSVAIAFVCLCVCVCQRRVSRFGAFIGPFLS